MTILGHDCNNQPLHAGDLVELVGGIAEVVGKRATIVGLCDKWGGMVRLQLQVPPGRVPSITPQNLKKISRLNDKSTWEKVSSIWTPRKVRT